MNSKDACIFTVPEQFEFDINKCFKDQYFDVVENSKIIVDFQHIKAVDYTFLHTLISMKSCFSSCMNEIHFINFSDEVNELLEEVHLPQFLEIPNLIH